MNEYIQQLQDYLARDFTTGALKILIIVVAVVLVFLAVAVDNKWILAGILAYEVLP